MTADCALGAWEAGRGGGINDRGERAGAGVRGSRSPKYEVGVANVVRLRV